MYFDFWAVLFALLDVLVYGLLIIVDCSLKQADGVVFSWFDYFDCNSGMFVLFFYFVL